MLSRFRHPAFSRKYLPIWISWIILVLLFTAGIFFFPSSGTNLRLLVSFVYVFALLLLPPIIICWYARRKANQQRRQLGTASPEEFHDEWRNWVKSKTFMTTVDEGSCAICLSDYSPGQDVRVLACKHKFHPQCFDSCFEENLPRLGRCHKCPLCRCDLGPVLSSLLSRKGRLFLSYYSSYIYQMSPRHNMPSTCCAKVLHFVEPAFSKRRYLISWGVYVLLIISFILMCVFWPVNPGMGAMVRAGVLICYGSLVTVLPPMLIIMVAYVVEQNRSIGDREKQFEKVFLDQWSMWVASETTTKTLNDDDVEDLMERGDGSGCVICLSDFKVGDEVRVLPCGHEFHTECFDSCFNRLPCCTSSEFHQCPLCRSQMGPSIPKRNYDGSIREDITIDRAHSISEASTVVSV